MSLQQTLTELHKKQVEIVKNEIASTEAAKKWFQGEHSEVLKEFCNNIKIIEGWRACYSIPTDYTNRPILASVVTIECAVDDKVKRTFRMQTNYTGNNQADIRFFSYSADRPDCDAFDIDCKEVTVEKLTNLLLTYLS